MKRLAVLLAAVCVLLVVEHLTGVNYWLLSGVLLLGVYSEMLAQHLEATR